MASYSSSTPPPAAPRPRAAKASLPARERLLATALDLFTRRGYAATSVREIAEGAGVTKPILYHHFGSKAGIFVEMVGRLEREVERRLEEARRPSGSPIERIRAICRSSYDALPGRENEVRLLYAMTFGPTEEAPAANIEALPRKIEDALAEAVREGMADDSIRKGDLRLTTLALQGSLITAIECHLVEGQASLGPEGFDRLLDVVLRGVAAPRPARRPRKRTKESAR